MPEMLGTLLVNKGLITQAQLDQALAGQLKHHGRLGTNLVECGVLDTRAVAQALSEQRGMPVVAVEEYEEASSRALVLVSARLAKEFLAIPLRLENRALVVAMASAFDQACVDAFERALRSRVEARLGVELHVLYYLERYYNLEAERPVAVRKTVTRKDAVATHAGLIAPDASIFGDAQQGGLFASDDELYLRTGTPMQVPRPPPQPAGKAGKADKPAGHIVSKWVAATTPAPKPLPDDLPVLEGLPVGHADLMVPEAEVMPELLDQGASGRRSPVASPTTPPAASRRAAPTRDWTVDLLPEGAPPPPLPVLAAPAPSPATAPGPKPATPALERQATLEFDLLAAAASASSEAVAPEAGEKTIPEGPRPSLPTAAPPSPKPANALAADWVIEAEPTATPDWVIESAPDKPDLKGSK
jgi:hypothetical protein